MSKTRRRLLAGLWFAAALCTQVSIHAQGLARGTPEAAGLSKDALARIAPAMQAFVDSGRVAGIAVAIANDLKLPIRYVGVGEGIDDLVPFSPEDYVTALFEEKW